MIMVFYKHDTIIQRDVVDKYRYYDDYVDGLNDLYSEFRKRGFDLSPRYNELGTLQSFEAKDEELSYFYFMGQELEYA